MENFIFDYKEYMKWIKFKDTDIYNLFKDDSIDDDLIEYSNMIWNEVIEINKVNYAFNKEANYLLFTHLFIINSEYFNPSLYDKYGIGSQMANIGIILTNVSDSSTNVGSTVSKAASNLSLSQQGYMTTKFGYKYICLISSLNVIRVI